MAQRTRAQLLADNAALFVSGTNIPAPSEKAYNDNEIDSFAMNAIVVLSNTTAVNDQSYVNVANATYTDPAPAEGKGYSVFVRNGTATIGAVAYSSAGTVIYRIYHFGVWSSYPQENVANKVSDTSVTPDSTTEYPNNLAILKLERAGTTYHSGPPSIYDDVDEYYISNQSVWMNIDTVPPTPYLCLDNSDGNAVWEKQPIIKSFDVTLGDPATNQAMSSTPIELVPDNGFKIQLLAAYCFIEGGTTDYDFTGITIIGDEGVSLTKGYGALVDVTWSSGSITYIPKNVNQEAKKAFFLGSRSVDKAKGIWLFTDGGDATVGNRFIRVFGTYALIDA